MSPTVPGNGFEGLVKERKKEKPASFLRPHLPGSHLPAPESRAQALSAPLALRGGFPIGCALGAPVKSSAAALQQPRLAPVRKLTRSAIEAAGRQNELRSRWAGELEARGERLERRGPRGVPQH